MLTSKLSAISIAGAGNVTNAVGPGTLGTVGHASGQVFQNTLAQERSADVSGPSGYTLLPAGGATAALTGISPAFGIPAWQSPMVGTSANPPDLRAPSNDTNGLLNQYLYAYNNWGTGLLPADTSPLFNNLSNVKAQIVQLMGSTLMSGPSYTGGMGYAISSADVATAEKLASETNGDWNYNPDLLRALGRGLAGYAVNGPIPGATTGSYGASFGITGGAPGPSISTRVTELTAGAIASTTQGSAARTGVSAATSTTAARIAALQYTIAHDTQRYRVQRAAGNKITAAADLASVAAARKALAKLQA